MNGDWSEELALWLQGGDRLDPRCCRPDPQLDVASSAAPTEPARWVGARTPNVLAVRPCCPREESSYCPTGVSLLLQPHQARTRGSAHRQRRREPSTEMAQRSQLAGHPTRPQALRGGQGVARLVGRPTARESASRCTIAHGEGPIARADRRPISTPDQHQTYARQRLVTFALADDATPAVGRPTWTRATSA